MKAFIKSLSYVLLYLLTMVLLQGLGGFVLGIYLYYNGIHTQNSIAVEIQRLIVSYNGVFIIATGIITYFIFKIILKKKNDNISSFCKFNKINLKVTLSTIILTLGLVPLINLLAGTLALLFPSYNEVANSLSTGSKNIIGIAAFIIVAPFFEELLCRGMVLNTMKKANSAALAIIIQAILFGFMHLNIVQGIYAAILGIVLGTIDCLADSIYPSILSHIIFNLFGIVILQKIINDNNALIFIISGVILTVLGFVLLIKCTKKQNSSSLTNVHFY